MNTEPQRRRERLSRRGFLQRAWSGSAWAAGASFLPLVRTRAATGRENPFSYDLERYRRVDPQLVRYHLVGGFRSPRPEPRRLAMDRDGRLYLAADRQVIQLTAEGAFLNEIACAAPTRCVAVADDGTLYVGLKDHVEVYDRKGQRAAQWDPLAKRPFLTGLAVGSNDLFAADAGNRLVWRYDRSGRLLGRIGERNRDRNVPGLVIPSPCLDVEIAPDGLLRVNNPGRHRVEAYTPDGDVEFHWGRPSAAIDGFCGCCNPVNLALLPDGRCVTFEKGLPRVKVYDAEGRFESVVAAPDAFTDSGKEFAGADPDRASIGGLDGVLDRRGRVYALDLLSGQIQIFQPKPAGPSASPKS